MWGEGGGKPSTFPLGALITVSTAGPRRQALSCSDPTRNRRAGGAPRRTRTRFLVGGAAPGVQPGARRSRFDSRRRHRPRVWGEAPPKPRPLTPRAASPASNGSPTWPPAGDSGGPQAWTRPTPVFANTLVSDHIMIWVGTAAPRRLRAGARTAGPGRRYRRRPGALRVTAPILRRDHAHAYAPLEPSRADCLAEPKLLNRSGSRHG